MVLVTIIVPTVGTPKLRRCVESILEQSVPCNVLVVADGPDTDVWTILEPDPRFDVFDRLKILELPENVGGPPERLLGHPIYAAMPFLCKTKYVSFLDEDNFMDPDHIESLLELCESRNLKWAYSLRKICEDGRVRCTDNCESLGGIAHAFDRQEFFVDTSCFLVRRDVAMSIGHRWYHPHADRPVSKFLIQEFSDYGCTFQATLNYDFSRENARGQGIEYFDQGNSKTTYDFQKKTFFVTKPCPWIRDANQVPAHDRMPVGSVVLVPARTLSDVPMELLKKAPKVDKVLVLLDPPADDNCMLYERDITDMFTSVMTPWSDFRCPTRVPCPTIIMSRTDSWPWHISEDAASHRTRRPFMRLPGRMRSSEVLVVREVPIRWTPPIPNPSVLCECYPEVKIESLRKHAYALVYEDHDAKGFVDNLLWQSLAAGTIPVYMGPRENLRDIPKECYVDGTLFPGEALAVFLECADVRALQKRMYEHRPMAFKNVIMI